MASKYINLIISKLSTKKSPGSDGFLGEFSEIFKEELTQMHHYFFLQNEKGSFPNFLALCTDTKTKQ